ncbi:MAG: heme o synthase [Alphaproteobacteria bacterium]
MRDSVTDGKPAIDTTDADAQLAEAQYAEVRDFMSLLKPRVMSLVVFTALIGLVAAPVDIHPLIGFTAVLAIAVGAGASGALNMWYDRDIDAVMSRTKNRPIPAGKVTAEQALSFGLILSVLSILVLGVLVNYVAAALLAFTIFFYAVVYTMWLKRSTPQNIVIGGAAGAFPPMIGWAAATGTVGLESLSLFLIIFLWTPAHFWALALVKEGDYGKVGVPMMPNVAGPDSTRNQIVVYTLLTLAISSAPFLLGFAGMVYAATAAIGGSIFLILALMVWRVREGDKAAKTAMRLFGFSILYLFVLFASLGLEHTLLA